MSSLSAASTSLRAASNTSGKGSNIFFLSGEESLLLESNDSKLRRPVLFMDLVVATITSSP